MKMRVYTVSQSIRSRKLLLAAVFVAGSISVLSGADVPASGNQTDSAVLGKKAATSLEISKKEITDLMAKGLKRASEKKYEDAFACFNQAEKLIGEMKITAVQVELMEKLKIFRIQKQHEYGEQQYRKCKDTYLSLISNASDDNMEALKKLKEDLNQANRMYYLGVLPGLSFNPADLEAAQSKDPAFASRINQLIEDCSKIQQRHDFAVETSLANIDPTYKDRQKDINRLYREGEVLYRNKQYIQVRDKMEQILIRDPYNERAMRLLELTYKKLYFIGDMRIWNEFLRDQTAIEWNWMENIPRDEPNKRQKAPKESVDNGSALYERLKNLMLDSVEFNDADVSSAITYLRSKSKDLDPDGMGVNIIFDTAKLKDRKKVTLQLDSIPFLEAVRYLCQVAGLNYRINEKEKALMIGAETDSSDMDTRYITVRYAIIKRLIGADKQEAEEDTKSSSSGKEFSVDSAFEDVSTDDTFTSGAGSDEKLNKGQKVTSDILKKHFAEYGIPFGDGTFIAYDKRANKLTVTNTPENLRNLELLIREMDVDNPLVLIESKVLEIKMNDLEELGFDWLLTHDNERNPRYNWSMESPIRNSGFSNNVLINNMNILPNFGGDNVWSLYLTVYAVDRTDRAEVLATPKVIANSGNRATIQMVREMYFPESWNEPEIETSNGSSISFTPSYPEFGDAKPIGIMFTVCPVVSPNNYTILLELNPLLTDLTGWSDYSYEYILGAFGSQASDVSYPSAITSSYSATYKATLKMPEISVRTVETKVKVYDGQTVMIGGIMRDKQGTLDDQWPLFGDIPLLGRLFSESASKIERDNLLISVTTRLISGDGIPVRSNKQNGLPDFRR